MRTRSTAYPKRWRVVRIFAWMAVALYALVFLAVLVSTMLDGFSNHLTRSLLATLLMPGMLVVVSLVWATALVTRSQAERRYKRWRLALWFGEAMDAPLADPQPVTAGTTPTSPITIEWQARWLFVWGAGIVLSLLFATLLVTSTLLANDLDASRQKSVVSLVIAVVGSFLFFLIVIWSATFLKGRVTATDDALIFAAGNRAVSIRWNDARLFAISGRRERGARWYELSCPGGYTGKVIRWERHSRSSRLAPVRPALPFDDYERQMDALLGVIAARTGLPLYDFVLQG